MRSFSIKQIEDYLNYLHNEIVDAGKIFERCVFCGQSLSKVGLPKGPENKVICLEHREAFVDEYEELIKLGILNDTEMNGKRIKTYEEEEKEKQRERKTVDEIEGLSIGEIILLDWIDLKKVSKKKPGYFDYWYGIEDGELASSKLNQDGYIRVGEIKESLYGLNLGEIKMLLKKNYVKATGTKEQLLEMIQTELDIEDYLDFLEPIWILTNKGNVFLKKYSIFIWAHKAFSTIGYEIAVTPYSVIPYANLSMSNETIAIAITQKKMMKF